MEQITSAQLEKLVENMKQWVIGAGEGKPVLPKTRFAEHPEVTPVVVQRLEEPSTGAGEEVMGATAAAIANALFDAIGVRVGQYPLTSERVRAALKA